MASNCGNIQPPATLVTELEIVRDLRRDIEHGARDPMLDVEAAAIMDDAAPSRCVGFDPVRLARWPARSLPNRGR